MKIALPGCSIHHLLFAAALALALPSSAQAADRNADKGKTLIQQFACMSCHDIPGIRGPASDVGPPLKHMARRAYIAGVIPNTPENMLRWLMNPPGVDPRTAMPDMGISEAQARDMAAYLATLD